MNEAEDLADFAWWTPEELQRSIIAMLRRHHGDVEISPDGVQAEMIAVLSQTLKNLYRALDAKDALGARLLARLHELGQGGLHDEAAVVRH